MPSEEERIITKVTSLLNLLGEPRAKLHQRIHNWLTNNGTNPVRDEGVAHAFLILMQWDATKRLADSSRKLEILSFGLFLFTAVLLGLTIALLLASN